MYDTDATLLHQIAYIAITQFIGAIPSHGLNDKKMIEMTAFKEFGLLGREGVMPTIIHNYQDYTRTCLLHFVRLHELSDTSFRGRRAKDFELPDAFAIAHYRPRPIGNPPFFSPKSRRTLLAVAHRLAGQ